MPRIPFPRYLRPQKTDYKDAPDWFHRFLATISEWLLSVTDTLSGGIELGQHCYCEIKSVEMNAPGSGNAMNLPLQTKFSTPVKGVVLLGASLRDSPLTPFATPVTIDWKPSPQSVVTLTAVDGPSAGTPITLTLLIVGG